MTGGWIGYGQWYKAGQDAGAATEVQHTRLHGAQRHHMRWGMAFALALLLLGL